MTASPLSISFVLPNYNHSRELRTSLPALLAQVRPADEILIVDDGSTDDSAAVIESFAIACRAIRLVRHQQRLGVAAAVNRGLREASGDYVILVSADEKVEPEMTAELEKAMLLFPKAELAVSFYGEWFPEQELLKTHDQTSVTGMWYVPADDPLFVGPQQLGTLLLKNNVYLHVNTAMFRRRSLLDIGGFDPALRWHSDWFAIYAIALRSGFCAVPRSLAWFRVDEASYSTRGIRDTRQQQQVMVSIIDKLRRPEFQYFRRAVLGSPVLLSPFMRSMLTALLKRPRYWTELLWICSWWLKQVVQGRRPAVWALQVQHLKDLLAKTG